MHLCAGKDCCATVEDTLRQAERLLDEVVFRALPTPSENKWTKMEPAGSSRQSPAGLSRHRNRRNTQTVSIHMFVFVLVLLDVRSCGGC